MAASEAGRADVVSVILKEYTDHQNGLHMTDKDGCTALHLASMNGKFDIATLLLHQGADPNSKDFQGNKPVHYLMTHDSEECISVVKQLLLMPVGWNSKNLEGETPLHFACRSAPLQVVYLLLKAGGDPSIESSSGQSCVSYGMKKESNRGLKIVEMINNLKSVVEDPSTTVSDAPSVSVANLLQSPAVVTGYDSPITMGGLHRKPIVLVPGLCSSALEVWKSPWNGSGDMNWFRTRVWLSLAKLGRNKNEWMQHMLLAHDCDDPAGIKVRAVEGLHGVDFLSEDLLVKDATSVFSALIANLAMHGYNNSSLTAATYDWRIPPSKLEERDQHYTRMMATIELLKKMNQGRKVVLIAHSMGNRLVQYFLKWVQKFHGQQWIDDHIDTFVAVGAPWLGSPKAVKGTVVGEKFGLDLFLNEEEGRRLCRATGTMPWLFPLRTQMSSHPFYGYIRRSDSPSGLKNFEDLLDHFEPYTLEHLCKLSGAEDVWDIYKKYFLKDELFWDIMHDGSTEEAELIPVLEAPPVKRLVCIQGYNVKTECTYMFKPAVEGDGYVLDNTVNMELGGLSIRGGVGFETPRTQQNHFNVKASGDGTVPYMSLNYAKIWKETNKDADIIIHELPEAEHRAILQDRRFFSLLYKYIAPV
eukprot:TRINITY_DN4058_c0_g1_i2.p1 TRINITY_DN4058_c0_g1~~TRINITY_DN4058_c0_g1_i2.p1  ORF type:complete len:642 (-),score=192.45 TRINITY_DN4058_c0_g1_i2:22-1947(-)